MIYVGLQQTARVKGLGEISKVCQSRAYFAIPAGTRLFLHAGRHGQDTANARHTSEFAYSRVAL